MKPFSTTIQIVLGIITGLAVLGIIGGFMYFYFPRTNSVITSCKDLAGKTSWMNWPQGCRDKNGEPEQCAFLVCRHINP